MRTEDGEGFAELRERLKDEGFVKTKEGYIKPGDDPADFTTVQVLAAQNAVEIYFGQMGVPKRLSRDYMTPGARTALDLALSYVNPVRIVDHTDAEVDPVDLLK